MPPNRGYKSFEDFERSELRPNMRIGWSVDELEETGAEAELDFDADPFDAAAGDSDDTDDEESVDESADDDE